MNHNATHTTEDTCPVVRHKIGQTTYIVKVHFNEESGETMSDKIKRLLRNEVMKM